MELCPALQVGRAPAQASSRYSQARSSSGSTATGPNPLLPHSLSASHSFPSLPVCPPLLLSKWTAKGMMHFHLYPPLLPQFLGLTCPLSGHLCPPPLWKVAAAHPPPKTTCELLGARGQANCYAKAFLSTDLILMVFPESTYGCATAQCV